MLHGRWRIQRSVWTELKFRYIISRCVWMTNWLAGKGHMSICPHPHPLHSKGPWRLRTSRRKINNLPQQTKTRKSKQTNKQQAIFVYACFPVPSKKEGQFLWLDLRVWTVRCKGVGKQVKNTSYLWWGEGEGWAPFFLFVLCDSTDRELSRKEKKATISIKQKKKKMRVGGNGWTYRVLHC